MYINKQIYIYIKKIIISAQLGKKENINENKNYFK